MKKTVKALAAELAVLQNNIDVYYAEMEDLPSSDQARYLLAIDQLKAKLDGILFACGVLGAYVCIDGPEMHRTCVVRLSATYTSHARQPRRVA